MKVGLLVVTKKGHYAERQFDARTVADAQKKAMEVLDKLPATIEDEHSADWTKIVIEIIR